MNAASKKYDVVIAGAGIAGLYCGWKLASAGMKVCIVDRKSKIGLPVFCGEATGNRAELSRFLPIDESWICSNITGLSLRINQSSPFIKLMDETGVILHRDLFEQRLYENAVNAGCTVILETPVVGLFGTTPLYTGLLLEDGNHINGSIIIGADGPESHVGRWAAITTALPLSEAYSGVQYRIKSDFCNNGMLHFFIGSEIIPRGYIWVFPKNDGWISVGAGLYGSAHNQPKAKEYLDIFIQKEIGPCQKEKLICGSVPMAVCPKTLHAHNVVVVGDAARQANPLTAGGIMNALEAADLLVRSLIKSGDTTPLAKRLHRYSTTWARAQRRQQLVSKFLQTCAVASSDRDIEHVILRAQSVFSQPIDRTRPFTWPVSALVKLAATIIGIVVRGFFSKR